MKEYILSPAQIETLGGREFIERLSDLAADRSE
jgi:hypothetical protein